MLVELAVNQRLLRRWHIELAERLGQVPGVAIGLRWVTHDCETIPPCATRLMALEEAVEGGRRSLSMPADAGDLSRLVGAGGIKPDIVIDLAGTTPSGGRRRWRLTFDGASGENALAAAILAGRAPIISLTDIDSAAVLADARPALDQDGFVDGLEAVFSRAISLVVSAVKGRATPLKLQATPAAMSCSTTVRASARTLRRAALGRLSGSLEPQHHVRTGWRFVSSTDLVDLGAHPVGGWNILADDGLRDYANPFPIVIRGETWLFVAERDRRSGKSVISAVRFDEHGPLGAPVPVLEQAGSLTYPVVFEVDGIAWMVPQSEGEKGIDLYRATRFPGGWRREARLVDDVEATDATPFRHAGRWWMTATVRDGGSASDALHLWSARELRGPWKAHPGNPVLIDAATARGAGRVVERGGRLFRPVQDRRIRGTSSVAIAEITRLDDDSIEQRIRAEIGPGLAWPGRGIATLNRAGSLECIDGEDVAAYPDRTRSDLAQSRVPMRSVPPAKRSAA